jgi:chromosome segregation ATPase
LFSKEHELSEVHRQKDSTDKKYQSLLTNFNVLDEESTRKDQEILGLRRQISAMSNYEPEIQSLTEAITKKNQEILELKSLCFECNDLKI